MRCFSHLNLHTSDLAGAADFYLRGCGLGVARTDGNADAAFLSTGFNHHEVEIFRGERAHVRHLGLECDSPAELEALLPRLQKSGVAIDRLSLVPGLMQSIFCRDPEGNGLHLFANLTADWRAWQAGAGVADSWTPDPARPPARTGHVAGPLTVTRHDEATRIARRFAGGGLSAAEPAALAAFYADVLGFGATRRDAGVVLSGSLAGNHLVIEPAGAGRPGLAWIAFTASGVTAPETLRDPLGLAVRLHPAG